MMFDWLYWWAGRRWGENAITSSSATTPRPRPRTAKLERIIHRFGWLAIVIAYFQPVPNVLIYAAAGWTRMRLRTFLLLDLIGSLLWIALCVGLGYAIGQRAVDVAKGVSRYALYVTIALVAIVLRASTGPPAASAPDRGSWGSSRPAIHERAARGCAGPPSCQDGQFSHPPTSAVIVRGVVHVPFPPVRLRAAPPSRWAPRTRSACRARGDHRPLRIVALTAPSEIVPGGSAQDDGVAVGQERPPELDQRPLAAGRRRPRSSRRRTGRRGARSRR